MSFKIGFLKKKLKILLIAWCSNLNKKAEYLTYLVQSTKTKNRCYYVKFNQVVDFLSKFKFTFEYNIFDHINYKYVMIIRILLILIMQ